MIEQEVINLGINPNPLPPFKVLYKPPKGTWLIINIGGRGGGKSHETSKFVLLKVLAEKKRCALLRDEQNTIGQSIMHEIKTRYNEINEKAEGVFDYEWDMQDKALKYKRTNTLKIFSKGFRASNTNQKASLKSIADVDIALIEEFEDINDEERFNTFADSIRKENALILINSNVPHKDHWFVKRYFNLMESKYPGYFVLQAKDMPGVVYIFSSYEDNIHLPEKTVERYKAYGDASSPFYNLEHYCTDILGLVSEGAKGRIFKNWEPVTNDEFNKLPHNSFYGLDFGYSSDPAAMTELKFHNNKLYIKELIYQTGLTNPDLYAKIESMGINGPIYADSAEPKSIEELKRMGLNILPSVKGADSIRAGINFIKGMQVFYVESSANLIQEKNTYRWAMDANNEPTDKPEDKNNHLMDSLRYGSYTHLNNLVEIWDAF